MFDLRLLFVAAIWGINFSMVKYALADFRPLSFTAVRFLCAALFLLSVMAWTREPAYLDRRDRAPIARLGFLGITIYNIFFMFGLNYTTVSHSALFISLSPLVAALIQAATGRERITPRGFFGLGIALFGVITIIRSQHGAFSFSSRMFLGDVLTLCATVTWALYTLTARPLLERYSALKVTAYNMAIGSVLLIPFSLPDLLRQEWMSISLRSWLALGFAAFLSAGVAFSLWYQGVQRIGVTRTIVYHYLVPFTAVIFAAVFLGEAITPSMVLGGASTLAGIFLVQRMRPRRP